MRGTLKDVFAAVPEPYGDRLRVEPALRPSTRRRNVLRGADDRAGLGSRRPQRSHEPVPAAPEGRSPGGPEIAISFGSHSAFSQRWRALHHWHPADVLHFPFRSLEQWENKGVRRARGDKPLGQYVTRSERARGDEARAISRPRRGRRDALERGRAKGSLVVDLRLRDALRSLGCKATRRRCDRWRPRRDLGKRRRARCRSRAVNRLRRRPQRPRRRSRRAELAVEEAGRHDRMRVVLTSLVDDADETLDAHLAFHLNAGVDVGHRRRPRDGRRRD